MRGSPNTHKSLQPLHGTQSCHPTAPLPALSCSILSPCRPGADGVSVVPPWLCSVALAGVWGTCSLSVAARSWPSPPRAPLASCPLQERVQPAHRPPGWPWPCLLLPRDVLESGQRASSPSVPQRADLIHGGAANLQLVVELVDSVCQVMHRAGAQGAARPPC